MRALFWILLIVSSNCWEQTWKEFNPTLGKTIDLSRDEKKHSSKDLKMMNSLMEKTITKKTRDIMNVSQTNG